MSTKAQLFKEKNDSYKSVAAQNKKATDEYLKMLNSVYDNKLKEFKKQIEAQKAAIPQSYRQNYDLNVINKLISERNLKEKMSNLGLTQSGLTASSLAGLEIQKNNADNLVTSNMNKSLNALNSAYNNYLNQITTEKAEKKTQAVKELNEKNADLLEALNKQYNNALAEIEKEKVKASKTITKSSTNNDRLLTIYSKLLSNRNPSSKIMYLNLLTSGGMISNSQKGRMLKALGLY